MSKHLIQAIDIDGTKYCVKHGATTPKWRTISELSPNDITGGTGFELTGAENDDSWDLFVDDDAGGNGVIGFATCCIWKFTITWDLSAFDSDDAVLSGSVFLNSNSIFYWERTESLGESIQYEVDLNALGFIGRACGNIFGIEGRVDTAGGTLPSLQVSITDVTFGPPV
jgi:hypothetical protein